MTMNSVLVNTPSSVSPLRSFSGLAGVQYPFSTLNIARFDIPGISTMVKLGSWTTIDCPTGRLDEAQKFLEEKFEAIGGKVRKVSNLHDGIGVGSVIEYPSFEIDMSDEAKESQEFVDLHEDYETTDEGVSEEEFMKHQTIYDNWAEKANQIEEEYSEKFEDVL